jgi:hypothetical protein
MTTMVRSTRSRGAYTTTLTTSTKQPCVSLDSAAVHCNPPPQSGTPLESEQASSGVADTLLSDFTGMIADVQDIGYHKVALNILPHGLVFTHGIGLRRSAP